MTTFLKRAAEDPRIYAAYPELPKKIIEKYPQLGKDIATTILSINDIKSIQLSIDIQRCYELMNMRPYEIDLNPELLFSPLAIRDLVRIRGGKSLQGTLLKQLGVAQVQHVVEKHIPVTPQPQQQQKRGILERLFGGSDRDKQQPLAVSSQNGVMPRAP